MNPGDPSKVKNPIVSVLLPVYEPEYEWLMSAVNSVLDQTFQDFELIVVDDGSSAPVASDVPTSITNRDDVRLFRQENEGFGGATNRAFRESHGRYVAPIGQDDIWEPRKLERQLSKIHKGSRAIFSSAKIVDESGEYVETQGRFPETNYLMELFYGCYPIYESVLLDKELIDGEWLVKDEYVVASDWDLWFRIFPDANVTYVEEPLVRKRSHDQQTTNLNYDQAVCEGLEILETYSHEYDLSEELRDDVFENFFRAKIKTLFRLGYDQEAVELLESLHRIDRSRISEILYLANYSHGRRLQRQGEYRASLSYLIRALWHEIHYKPIGAIALTPYFLLRDRIT